MGDIYEAISFVKEQLTRYPGQFITRPTVPCDVGRRGWLWKTNEANDIKVPEDTVVILYGIECKDLIKVEVVANRTTRAILCTGSILFDLFPCIGLHKGDCWTIVPEYITPVTEAREYHLSDDIVIREEKGKWVEFALLGCTIERMGKTIAP